MPAMKNNVYIMCNDNTR